MPAAIIPTIAIATRSSASVKPAWPFLSVVVSGAFTLRSPSGPRRSDHAERDTLGLRAGQGREPEAHRDGDRLHVHTARIGLGADLAAEIRIAGDAAHRLVRKRGRRPGSDLVHGRAERPRD